MRVTTTLFHVTLVSLVAARVSCSEIEQQRPFAIEGKLAKFDDETRPPYRVVNVAEGKWPSEITAGPFDPEEELFCHMHKQSCMTGQGVDHLFTERRLWCEVDDMIDDEFVRVYCNENGEEDEESRTIPIQCCERKLEGDTSIYSTPLGYIHYVPWREGPRTVVLAMDLVERTYLSELRNCTEESPRILLYAQGWEYSYYYRGHQENWNVPLRVQESLLYQQPFPRLLTRDDTNHLDSKWNVAETSEILGLNVKGGPFPVTYLSCKAALQAVTDPRAQFYIKPVLASLGYGIQVKTRAELQQWGGCIYGGVKEVIIQEGITDQALIGGRRFDVRFYILMHKGRVYMHQNAVLTWPPGTEYNASSTEEASAFAQKYLVDYDEENDLVSAFLTSKSTGKGKEWLAEIHKQLVAALPVMEPVVSATEAKHDNVYHIWGCDAMIRENGEAILIEFNPLPMMDWMHGQVTRLDDDGQEVGERSQTQGREVYEETVSTMLADFFAIVLGLADTTRATTTEESRLLKGRVREVIADHMPDLGSLSVLDEVNRPYRIVNASEGGWPVSLVSGPFDKREDVFCHVNMERCAAGEGVDLFFDEQHVWCEVEDMVNATHVRAHCYGDDESQVMPIQCCERHLYGDTSIYSTPHGFLHYANWENPRTIILAMDILERRFLGHFRSSPSKVPPILSYFRHLEPSADFDSAKTQDTSVPLRVQESSRYGTLYRTMDWQTSGLIENKWNVAKRAEQHGLNVKGGPFPVTYFSCAEAVEGEQDPTELFYIKPVWGFEGKGIEVKRRAEILEMMENGECDYGNDESWIIQRGITDLALIGGRRFDFRFYVLVHDGRVYMHQSAVIRWTIGPTYDASSTKQSLEFARKFLSDDIVLYAFLSSKSTGKGNHWLDAVYSQLVAALPIIEPITNITAADDSVYNILGGDALISENGDVTFAEVNIWPGSEWLGRGPGTVLDDEGQEVGPRSYSRGKANYEETLSTMFADFFAIVLGMADTSTSEGDGILEGRVREVIPGSSQCKRY